MCILSITVFAWLLIQQGWLQQSMLGCFTIIGTTGKLLLVKHFPFESCSCPATTQCYHIIVAKLSVGIPVDNQQKKINLIQLRQITRPRKEKRSKERLQHLLILLLCNKYCSFLNSPRVEISSILATPEPCKTALCRLCFACAGTPFIRTPLFARPVRVYPVQWKMPNTFLLVI